MKKHPALRNLYVAAMAAILTAVPANAQSMPQDYWYEEVKFGSSGSTNGQFNFGGVQSQFKGGGMAVASDGNLFVADTGNNRIQVFSKDGVFIRKWGQGGSSDSQFSAPRGIAFGSNDLLYVADSGNNRIQVFRPDGTFLRKWACNAPTSLTVDLKTGLVYVTDNSAKQVRVFQDNGTTGVLQQSWGSEGSLDGQFDDMRGIGIEPSGQVIVCAYSSIQKFTPSGEFVSASRGRGKYSFHTTADGLSVLGTGPDYGYGYGGNSFVVLDGMFQSVFSLGFDNSESVAAIASSPNGTIYVATIRSEIHRYDRSFRTQIPLSKRKALPVPVVVNAKQRPGTTYLDIDFKITDVDSQSVDVAALAFNGGGNSLDSAIILSTLEEGSAANLGLSKPANVEERLTWNAAADWSVDFGQVQIEILAKDEQGLIAFHWITIPSNGTSPSLTVCESPLGDDDLLPLWFWFIATGDPAVQLRNGKVYGVEGTYKDQLLANGSATTVTGRQFIYGRLGVRAITSSELSRAQSGNYNFKSLSLNSVVKLP
jgi:sugar lactone lactonase YvrE